MVSVTVGARAAESDVADLLRETEAANPGVAIGSYPFFKDGRYELKGEGKSLTPEALAKGPPRTGKRGCRTGGIRGRPGRSAHS